MALILKQIFNFFRLLNSDSETNQLAAGLAVGMVLGFAPLLSLQSILIFFLLFFLRIQLGAALVSCFFFKMIAFVLDPLSDQLGRVVLESQALRPLFQDLYNLPIVPLTRFNNSIVMGSGLVSLILAGPLFLLFRVLIVKYRSTVVTRFHNTRIWKMWMGTRVYAWYCTYENIAG